MRRAVLATAATVSGLAALLALKPQQPPATATAPPPAARAPGSAAGAGAGADGNSADTVTGDTVRTQYGPVQVQVSLSSGEITDVKALQVPPEHADAVPRLTQAALAAQSAEIDAVSGATYTSEGYKESLQSALDQAAAAGTNGGSSSDSGEQEAEEEPGGYDY